MNNITLVNKADEKDVQVEWEDQIKINRFSSLNMKLETLQEKYDYYEKEKVFYDDLMLEMELFDEEEPVRYKIGDCFVFLNLEDAINRVEADKEKIDNELSEVKSMISNINNEMDGLKVALYAKFGKSINLDKD